MSVCMFVHKISTLNRSSALFGIGVDTAAGIVEFGSVFASPPFDTGITLQA